MRTGKVVLALLFATLTLADINKDYESLLHGKTKLTQDDLDDLYEQFLSEYKDGSGQTPSNKFALKNADRKSIFANKVQEIIVFNSQSSNTYKKGINAFTDMTEEEFFGYHNIVGDQQQCSATYRSKEPVNSLEAVLKDMPSHWDWRDQGFVSPVKNQGSCGSCWTFSTVGCLESHFLMKYGQFRNLSEQQLVDCAGDFDNHGCNGGLPSHAFEYIKHAGGISTEDAYPYMMVTNNCTVDSATFSVGVSGGSVNISLSEDDLKVQLFQHGPVSVAFQVVNGFKDYKSGVYTSDVCKNGPEDVNHAVLAVGYGTQDGKDYWIIKNSWGASWGDNGYFKMERGVNMCGIVNCNSYPEDVIDLTKAQVFLQ